MSATGDIALRFMEALWAGDQAACSAMLTEDAVWQLQPGMPQASNRQPTTLPAREALARIVADLFGRFDPEGFSVTVTRVIADEHCATIEYAAQGRTAQGTPYKNIYCTILVLRDDQVAEVRPYNDTWHMRRALGLDG